MEQTLTRNSAQEAVCSAHVFFIGILSHHLKSIGTNTDAPTSGAKGLQTQPMKSESVPNKHEHF